MSHMSLSQLAYSAIGFSKTMTEEFEDLKKNQRGLSQTLNGVLVWYYTLIKQKWEAEEKAATKGAAEAVAKSETTGEKPTEEGGESEIQRSVSASQYCETRADLIDAIQEWTTEASRTIAMFPSKRSAHQIKRTIDFVNKSKVILRKT